MDHYQTIQFLREMVKIELRHDQLCHIEFNLRCNLARLNDYYNYPNHSEEFYKNLKFVRTGNGYEQSELSKVSKTGDVVFFVSVFLGIGFPIACFVLYQKKYGYYSGIVFFIAFIISLTIFSIINNAFQKKHEENLKKYKENNEATLTNTFRNITLNQISKLQSEYDNICQFLEISNTIRANYYNAAGIHQKYWNLESVAAFLDYFETGICDSFVGSNGAYSRFETDSRFKTIIGKLENIETRLDNIDMQLSSLRQEIKKNNIAIMNVSNQILNSLNTTNNYLASIDYTNKINQANIESYTVMKALELIIR